MNFTKLEDQSLKSIRAGHNKWQQLGEVTKGMVEVGAGGAALGSVVCGPGCAVLGGLAGVAVGGATGALDAQN
ncbi:hypothetical protein AWM75_04350 [Aerococcus urinaehominis]|uniref:Uncharacterized protein n=1 Tax=Aerococcus urinaehominis TaxID=128944 RepID=A0A109RGP6_9LACT|nr:hypothetical protein [Aerococcus urinaehominis]AMB99278.1 hypothetical protein AWM75_04350 [Aerococcus urinaehominis]SDM47622.1 hypothetical protein SAMN04487985_11839 [Aerococcus urinaehominis]